MKNTTIEWANHTFNPWWGCTKVSEGCANCYAETWSKRTGKDLWGPGKARERKSRTYWNQPINWNLEAAAFEERPRVFCASMADWLDHEVPAHWRAGLLELIDKTPNLDWLLLTKRPEAWEARMAATAVHSAAASRWRQGYAPPNVWVGVSAENQERWNERLPMLYAIPARIRFVSAEPLLGPIEMGPWKPDWLIVGGESGPGARPTMHPDYVRHLRDQCEIRGTAFFFKQWGNWVEVPAVQQPGDTILTTIGGPVRHGAVLRKLPNKNTGGRQLDGRTWDQVPTPK